MGEELEPSCASPTSFQVRVGDTEGRMFCRVPRSALSRSSVLAFGSRAVPIFGNLSAAKSRP